MGRRKTKYSETPTVVSKSASRRRHVTASSSSSNNTVSTPDADSGAGRSKSKRASTAGSARGSRKRKHATKELNGESGSAARASERKRVSFADELAELANPTHVDYDPEDELMDEYTRAQLADQLDTDAPRYNDGDDDSDDEQLGANIVDRRRQQRSKLREDAGLDEVDLGVAYKGAVVSRKELVGSDDDDDDDYDDDDDDDDDDGNDDQDEAGSVDTDDMELPRDANMDFGSDDSDSDDFGFGVFGDGDGDGDDDDSDDDDADDSGGNALADALDQLQQTDSTSVFRKGSENGKSAADMQASKAIHVRSQKSLWESGLNTRIRLQKVLNSTNRLPKPRMHAAFVNHDEQIADKMQNVSDDAKSMLQDMFSLQHELSSQAESIAPRLTPFQPRSNKRRKVLDECWEHMQTSFSSLISYSNQVIDKWNTKIQMTSGKQALEAVKFKAFNQPITSQIQQILFDEERLLKRTQRKRSDYRVVGDTETKTSKGIPHGIKQTTADDEDDIDSEIFDDTDFYQDQLRQIISSGMEYHGDEELLGKQIKLKRKVNLKVDRRASKGRKLRFNVQEKLVNFMTPIPDVQNAFLVDELFAGLFGGKYNRPSSDDTNGAAAVEGSISGDESE
jgi:protein AATF/BFR2